MLVYVWERRKISREEPVQSPTRLTQAIAAMVSNFVKDAKPNSKIRQHGWERPRGGL